MAALSSQGLFYITALAIMQNFRDNEKKTIENDLVSLHFVLYAWSRCFALFLRSVNITK